MKYNWYKHSQIQREAGIKDIITVSLMGALVAVMSGSAIWNAAKKYKVTQQEIEQALEKKEVVDFISNLPQDYINQIKSFYEIEEQKETTQKETTQKETNISFDFFIKNIITHEGLLEKQTPFRITNPSMREWNTIHGFEIDKQYVPPKNRENFIFLKNPEDVFKAVKIQFQKYSLNPSRYGLPNQPTIKQAIQVFDQTGSEGKMKYLKNIFPNINFEAPLSSIVQ